MFYIVTRHYIGADPQTADNIDASTIRIQRSPARTNSSLEICTGGWCGSNGDWSYRAHGAFSTLDAAEQAVSDLFGDVRPMSPDEAVLDGEIPVRVYRFGAYRPMTPAETADWVFDDCAERVTPTASDRMLSIIASDLESDANTEGATLDHDALYATLKQTRDTKALEEVEYIKDALSDCIETLQGHVAGILPEHGNTAIECQRRFILDQMGNVLKAVEGLSAADLQPDPDLSRHCSYSTWASNVRNMVAATRRMTANAPE